jgi:hypothetical protein
MPTDETSIYRWRDFGSAPWFYSADYYKRKGLEDYSYQIQAAGGAAVYVVMLLLIVLRFTAEQFFPTWVVVILLVPVICVLRPIAMYATYRKLTSHRSP